MRLARPLLAICGFAALSALAIGAPSKNMAPADQYFGKLKLSFIGINNTFRDAAISAGAHTTDPAVVGKVDFAIDALNDWQRKFPKDPQLARTYFLAQITLKKIWIQKYQDKAWSYMLHIVAAFPNTFYGKTIKTDIARGFTQHYYAAAVPCDPEATPAPSVTTSNGKFKTVIETPPCITPVPTPSPTTAPTEIPAPVPSSSTVPASAAPISTTPASAAPIVTIPPSALPVVTSAPSPRAS